MAREKKIEAPVTLFASIETEQHEALRLLAFRERRSMADVVREAEARRSIDPEGNGVVCNGVLDRRRTRIISVQEGAVLSGSHEPVVCQLCANSAKSTKTQRYLPKQANRVTAYLARRRNTQANTATLAKSRPE
jgi:hypothetical protein